MTIAIVYAFAVEDGLIPVISAPSFAVLARQLPRLVVGQMNGEDDRGIRFFPLLGPRDGQRQFFSINDLLPPEKLVSMHGRKESVSFVVDGRIGSDSIVVRIHDVASLRRVFAETLPFDPLDPLPLVQRIMFELSGVLEWGGPPPAVPELVQPALSYFLVARDDLLSLEAGFEREGEGHWLRAIATAFEHRPDSTEIQELLFDICRRLIAIDSNAEEIRDLLVAGLSRVDTTEFLSEAAVLLAGAGWSDHATEAWERLVPRAPVSENAAVQLGGYLFKQNRHVEGRDVLEKAIELGIGRIKVGAQLAVFYQKLGEEEKRVTLIDSLAGESGLSPAVARLVCSDLIERECIETALEVADRCLEEHPDSAELWLEKSRAHMFSQDSEATRQALEEVLRHHPSPSVLEEVRRLRRFVDDPRVLPDLRTLDEALSRDDLKTGLEVAERVVDQYPKLAEGWLFLGVVRQRLDQPRRAIRAMREAIRIDADLGEAHNRLGILLIGRGRYQDGYDHLERAIHCMPEESGPRIHMAQACHYLGRIEDGREALREAERLGANPEILESVRRVFFG